MIKLNELREFIKQTLLEGRLDQLERAFKSYPHDGTVFFHFSDLNKLGINPRSKFDTPLGIYGYPLDENSWQAFSDKELPFASGRKFVHFFRAKDPSRVLELSSMTMEEAFEMWKKIVAANGIDPDSLTLNGELLGTTIDNVDIFDEKSHIGARVNKPGGKLWYYTWKEASGDTIHWNKMFRRADIDGCVDRGAGIIYHAEPSQAVFFSLNAVTLLESYDNVDPGVTTTLRDLSKIRTISNEKEFNDAFDKLDFKQKKYFLEKISRRQLQFLLNNNDQETLKDAARFIDERLLPSMMGNADPAVRRYVASRIDRTYLPKMMNDPNWAVRCNVAHRIDLEHLKLMVNDDNISVRSTARTRLEDEK